MEGEGGAWHLERGGKFAGGYAIGARLDEQTKEVQAGFLSECRESEDDGSFFHSSNDIGIPIEFNVPLHSLERRLRGTLAGSLLRNVDLTRELAPASDHEQATERNVLADHESEFSNFGVFEVLAQFRFEGRIHRSKVRRELLCEANGESLSGFEIAFRLGEMDLCDGLFVESLTRRRRVAGEESGVTFIESCDLEPGEFLDARGNDPLLMSGAEKREEPLEVLRDQFREVEGVVRSARCRGRLGAGHGVSLQRSR